MLHVLKPLPSDSTMALIELCRGDENPDKIDLGVGVFQNDAGETPILDVVKEAETFLEQTETTKSYVSPVGDAEFRVRMLELALGKDRASQLAARFAHCQTAGGGGALRIGADLIKEANVDATIWVSAPTWVNHFPLMGSNGLKMASYPYYDAEKMTLQFDEMLDFLAKNAKAKDVVLLHGCCHNPSGADLSRAQWDILAAFLEEQQLIPFIDLAYFGLGHGFEEDAYGTRKLIDTLPEVMVAASCSKNFAIYRERVGLFAVLLGTDKQATAIQSNLGAIQRRMISMPPSHGAAVVSHILGSEELHRKWLNEVAYMRDRVDNLRRLLSTAIASYGGSDIAAAVKGQIGLFSMLPLSEPQISALWDQSIYLTAEGRINIAGANTANVDRLAKAIMTI